MASDPDAMWKPGFDDAEVPAEPNQAWFEKRAGAAPSITAYGGRGATATRPAVDTTAARPAATLFDPDVVFDVPPIDDESAPASRKRRWVLPTIGLVALLATAGFVWSRVGTSMADRPVFEEIAGADGRRLPAGVEELWSVRIDRTGTTESSTSRVVVDGRELVMAVLDGDGGGSIIVGLEALTGVELWRAGFDFVPERVSVMGVLDDVLIIEQNDFATRRLVGIDTADGSTRWTRDTRDNGVHVMLTGTQVITRVSFTGTERLTFINPVDGEEVSRVQGRITSTDLSGTWYVANDRRFVSIDLSEGYSEPVEIARSGAQWDEPTAVVDGRILVVDTGGGLAEASSDSVDRVPLVAVGGDLPSIASLVPSGGQTFVAIGDGKVVGATLVDDTVQIGWSFDAAVREVDVTGRGLVLALSDATNGFSRDADLTIIDAVTGEQLGAVSAPPTDADLPRLLGDGFVLTDSSGLGLERIGYDLAGDEQWRIPSNDPITIGERIVVSSRSDVDEFVITAFGDAT